MTDQDDKAATGQHKLQGEGNYDASRKFDADEKAFIDKNRAAIPGLAQDAAEALDGPEGEALRAAEAKAKAHPAP